MVKNPFKKEQPQLNKVDSLLSSLTKINQNLATINSRITFIAQEEVSEFNVISSLDPVGINGFGPLSESVSKLRNMYIALYKEDTEIMSSVKTLSGYCTKLIQKLQVLKSSNIQELPKRDPEFIQTINALFGQWAPFKSKIQLSKQQNNVYIHNEVFVEDTLKSVKELESAFSGKKDSMNLFPQIRAKISTYSNQDVAKHAFTIQKYVKVMVYFTNEVIAKLNKNSNQEDITILNTFITTLPEIEDTISDDRVRLVDIKPEKIVFDYFKKELKLKSIKKVDEIVYSFNRKEEEKLINENISKYVSGITSKLDANSVTVFKKNLGTLLLQVQKFRTVEDQTTAGSHVLKILEELYNTLPANSTIKQQYQNDTTFMKTYLEQKKVITLTYASTNVNVDYTYFAKDMIAAFFN